jgi:hypothetical protein
MPDATKMIVFKVLLEMFLSKKRSEKLRFNTHATDEKYYVTDK